MTLQKLSAYGKGFQIKVLGALLTQKDFLINVRDTLKIVDKAYIIHDGKILKSGTPKEIIQDNNVKQVYLGNRFRF